LISNPRTVFLSRLLGLYFLAFGIAMLFKRQSSAEVVNVVVHNPVLVFLVGAILVPAGLALVLGHNVWSGGALPVVVTVVGWLALLKGLFFLLLPTDAAPRLFAVLNYDRYSYIFVGYVLLFGAYLTYAGFTSRSPIVILEGEIDG
jgi:hypothetical protein